MRCFSTGIDDERHAEVFPRVYSQKILFASRPRARGETASVRRRENTYAIDGVLVAARNPFGPDQAVPMSVESVLSEMTLRK